MGEGSAGNVVLTVITEFTSEFRTVIDGNTNDLSLNELSGGARISYVFHELFNNGVKGIDPFDQVKDGDIRTILYNSSVRHPFRCHLHRLIVFCRVLHRRCSLAPLPSRSSSNSKSSA